MTLAEAGEIFAYWDEHPPAHLMVQAMARLFGWAPRASVPEGRSIADIAAAAPSGLAVTRDGAAMPAPLDLDGMRARNRAQAVAIARRKRAATGG